MAKSLDELTDREIMLLNTLGQTEPGMLLHTKGYQREVAKLNGTHNFVGFGSDSKGEGFYLTQLGRKFFYEHVTAQCMDPKERKKCTGNPSRDCPRCSLALPIPVKPKLRKGSKIILPKRYQ